MRYYFFLIIILLFAANVFLNAQNFEISAVPDWVVPKVPPTESTVSKYDVNSGVYTSLFDYQINLNEGADFTHVALNILTNGGVTTASELSISYDTSYQELQFHYLYIWRNGEKIDKTGELSLEMLNNEQSLQIGIYTGLITAYDILEDVRKNDRLEYAYTVIGDNPIFDDNRFVLMPMEDVNPIDHYSLRVLYNKEVAYYHDCKGCDKMNVNDTIIGDNNIIEITQDNLLAGDYEETIPTWYIPYNYFVISSFKNWKEVNDWAVNVFQLKEEPNLNEVFEEIFSGGETTEEKMDAIINYVQNDIRYMGIESGIGSIKPFPPDQVVSQRFGDCKDKSLLMVTLFKKIGIDSCYPVLVNSTIQQGVNDLLPAAQLFDHCIVHYEHNGNEYWLDPSISEQGGNFKTKRITDYGKALVIREGEEALKNMNINDSISRSEVTEHFTISSFEKSGTLYVTTKMYGLNADFIRSILEYYSIKEISDQLKSAYSPLFPSIMESERLKIDDDIDSNIITIIEQYTISNLWHDEDDAILSKRVFQYEPIGLYNYIAPMSCDFKKNPVQVPFPSIYKHSTTIALPDLIVIANEDIKTENLAFRFRKISKNIDDKTIKINYSFHTKRNEVGPTDFQKICTQMNEISRDLPLQISYPKQDNSNPIQFEEPKKKKKKKKKIN